MSDAALRAFVYDVTMRSGKAPRRAEIATALGISEGETSESVQRLATARMLVLQRGTNEILMAPPFSAVPTPFVVETRSISYYANCIWDALGVPAMLRSNARITTSCGDCGAAMELAVENEAVRGEGVLHFAVPARDWWKDIVFT
jgi:hypothetical protein